MDDFAELFGTAFPKSVDHPWSFVLQNPKGEVQEYLALRGLAAGAVGDLDAAVLEALRAAADLRFAANLPVLVGVFADVASEVLVSGAEVAGRTRALMDALVSASRSDENHGLALGVAAVMHARAGDRMLANARLRGIKPEWLDPAEHTWQLVGYAARILAPEAAAAPQPEAPGGAVRSPVTLAELLWDHFLVLAQEPPLDVSGVLERVAEAAEHDPEATFDAIVEVLTLVTAMTGPSQRLDRSGPRVLAEAEQLVWVSGRARGPLWARLARAAARIGDTTLAARANSIALERVAALEMPPLPEHVTMAADLLETQMTVERLLRSPLTETADKKPERPAPRAEDEQLPTQLAVVLARGETLLVAGPDLPTLRGAPGRDALLRSLVADSTDFEMGESARSEVLASINQGYLDRVAPMLRTSRRPLWKTILEAYEVPAGESGYGALAGIPFSGVVNLGWDARLLEAFAPRRPAEISVESRGLLDTARSEGFLFTWLAGDARERSLSIGPRETARSLQGNETLVRFLNSAVESRPLVFLGVSAADVVDFFETLGSWTTAGDRPRARRYAVCARDDLWEFTREQLLGRYGVELIGYNPSDGDSLTRVVQRLAARTATLTSGTPSDDVGGDTLDTRLTRVVLTNIGAFEQLDVDLARGWNILLGNNGCGKSTLLRAVALGLCGDHPAAAAIGATLLRVGCERGAIELEVGGTRFRTELVRSPDSVWVRTSSLTPLQKGRWAVLGFPALRGMSMGSPAGLSSATQAPDPRVEDLLPLLRNEVDHRLDDIKQWIVNIDIRSRQPDGERWADLLGRFFRVLSDLTPGGLLELDGVDPASWDVWVRTDDGVVSVDQLSQGMSSTIAWVGNLLQRMYDIHQQSDDPAAEAAFVLIDELDAHLHPAWQRLVPRLTRVHFPNVQFMATSHSPLVVGSLDPGELFVATREPRIQPDGTERLVATIEPADVDAKGLRADQILTSPLFGLMTSRSPRFHDDTARYDELFTKPARTPDEEFELLMLRDQIARAYLDGESAAEREVEAASARSLNEPLALPKRELDPDKVSELRRLVGLVDAAAEADNEPPDPTEVTS